MKKYLIASLILLALIGIHIETTQAVSTLPSISVGTSPVAGSVLQTNGATSTWVTTSSLGISGSGGGSFSASGTAGQLLYFTGTNTGAGTSTLTYDTSTAQLSINGGAGVGSITLGGGNLLLDSSGNETLSGSSGFLALGLNYPLGVSTDNTTWFELDNSLLTTSRAFQPPDEAGVFALGGGNGVAGKCTQWLDSNTVTSTSNPCGSGGGSATATIAVSGFTFSSPFTLATSTGIQISSSSGNLLFANTGVLSFNGSTGAVTYAPSTTIPTNNNQLTNGAGYLTSSSASATITSAGFTWMTPFTFGTSTGISISSSSGNLIFGNTGVTTNTGNWVGTWQGINSSTFVLTTANMVNTLNGTTGTYLLYATTPIVMATGTASTTFSCPTCIATNTGNWAGTWKNLNTTDFLPSSTVVNTPSTTIPTIFVKTLNGSSGTYNLYGTANQITVTTGTASTTLSLPTTINTTNLNLSGTLGVSSTITQTGGANSIASTTVNGNSTTTNETVTNNQFVGAALNVSTTANVAGSSTFIGNVAFGTSTLTSGANLYANYTSAATTTFVQIGATSTATSSYKVTCLGIVPAGVASGTTMLYMDWTIAGVVQTSTTACP